MTLATFIESERPPPARLLDVGCGDGALVRALRVAGYDATGIDPVAPPEDGFRRIALHDLEEDLRYDVVVASLSLHHVADLDGGLRKIARLLVEGGVLVVDEFAWDRLDAATAAWFHEQQPTRAPTPDELRRGWEREHEGLHRYGPLREALDAHFDERHFEWRPYLHRLLAGAGDEARERSLIEARAINALGFRYLGTPRARSAL